jgi:hypothetical protein
MKRISGEVLAARAQELAETMHELEGVKEAANKVKKTWASKIKRLEERATLLAEAVRLKTDPDEQLELHIEGEKP